MDWLCALCELCGKNCLESVPSVFIRGQNTNPSMTPTPRITKAYFNAFYALMTTYRAEIFFWAIATSLPLIMMGIWVQAGASGAFAGFSSVDAARYFIGVFIFRQLTICWVIYEFEWDVVSGRLSSMLLHPVNPLWRYILLHAGEQFTRLPFSILFIGLSLFIFPEALWGSDERPGLWLPQWWGRRLLRLLL